MIGKQLILILILSLSLSLLSAEYPVLFHEEKLEAVSYLENNQDAIDEIAALFSSNQKKVMAVVYPELLRYNIFRDFLETTLLEQLYVRGVSEFADFSIGPFQMKPSFIETLEAHVKGNTYLEKEGGFILNYPKKNSKSIRSTRIQRLKSFEWQIKYAFCYFIVVEDCYSGRDFDSKEEQIRFFATAYNFGFDENFEDIKNWMTLKAFPYGKNFEIEQEAYGDIAVQYYNTTSLNSSYSRKTF